MHRSRHFLVVLTSVDPRFHLGLFLDRGVLGHPLDVYPGVFCGDVKLKGSGAIIYRSVLYLVANPFVDDGVPIRKGKPARTAVVIGWVVDDPRGVRF